MKKLFLVAAFVLPTIMSAAPVIAAPACGGVTAGYAVFTDAQFATGGTGCQEGDKVFSDFGLLSGAPPSGYQVFFKEDIVGGQQIYSVVFGGGVTYNTPFSFTYQVAIPQPSTNTIVALSGDFTVLGTNTTPTLRKQATAFDANGNMLGGSAIDFTVTGANRPQFQLTPNGTQRLVITDTFNPNTGAVSQLNNGIVQSGVPEPGTIGLMGLGLVAVGLVARRRRA